MRRRGRKSKRRGKMSIPVLPVAVLATSALSAWQPGNLKGTANHFVEHWTGYNMDNGNFDYNQAKGYWLGAGVAIVVHKVANKVGVNSYIRRMTGGYLSL